MKLIDIKIVIQILLLGGFLFPACTNSDTEHQSHQTRIPVSDEIIMEQLINSPSKSVLSRQSTVKLSAPGKAQILKAPGYIDFNRNINQTISVRFGGRIENLHVKYEMQYVKKGDIILDLYSSELNTIQEEHLFLLKSEGEKALLEQSRQKLKLLGITDNQISQLEKSKTVSPIIKVYSPIDGYVRFKTEENMSEKANISQNEPVKSMGMSGKNNTNFNAPNSQIREGVYVNKGQILFSVNNLKSVWAVVSLSSEFNSNLKINSEINILSELFPNKMLIGNIELVEQTFEDNTQRFIRVRINLPNSKGELKINSLITAEIPIISNEKPQIPVSAVYHTGLKSFVWVKTGNTQNGTGIFQLRKVTIGSVTKGMTTVIGGLSENEEIAEHAGYLTDSETFLYED